MTFILVAYGEERVKMSCYKRLAFTKELTTVKGNYVALNMPACVKCPLK